MTRATTSTLASATAVLLTLSCLGPLFMPHGGWIGPTVAAVLVASTCGALGRALPLSGVTGTILVIAGGLGLVTAVSAPSVAYLGFVPNGRSFSVLHDLFSDGFSDIRTYSPPVTASPGLILLVTSSVFLIAVAVDLFAVGAERPVLAGIPLLALVAVPAAFRPHGLGVLHLVLAFIGWLLLVAVDNRDRLTRWGRPLGRRSNVTPPLLLGGAAGRVAGVGVVAAFVFPALLPNLHGGIIHPPSQCCGGGSATVVAPLVTIDNQLHEKGATQLLKVTTTSAQYLRFTALDYFDGNSFSLVKSDAAPGKVDGRLSVDTPGVSGQIAQTPVRATIQVLPTLAERYLPLPYSPVDVKVSGTWQLSPTLRTVFSTKDTTAGKTFSVTSMVPTPTRAQLEAVPAGYDAAATPADTAKSLAQDLVVPASVPDVVFQDEAQVIQGQSTAFAKMAALERWFTTPSDGHFTYTLTPSPQLPSGAAGITSFLKHRQGFCEQFATVFTLMARHLGLPARVAVGFTPGETDPSSPATYDISTSDAHAWPEVWFSGAGWVRFEPTPRVSLASYTPSYLSAVSPPAKSAASPVPSVAPSTAPIRKPEADALKSQPLAALVGHSGGLSGRTVLILVMVALVVLIGLSPGISRLLLRRRRVHAARVGAAPGAAPAEVAAGSYALWNELMDTVRDVGVALPLSETPRATGRRLAGLLVPLRLGGDSFPETPFAVGRSLQWRPGPPESAVTGPPSRLAAPLRTAAGSTSVVGAESELIDIDRPVETVELGAEGKREASSGDLHQLLDALGRIVAAQEQARYGRPGRDSAVGGSSDDVLMIRGALIATTTGGVRMQALLLPRSVLGRVRGRLADGGQRTTRVMSTLGAPAHFLGRKLRRQ